MVAHNRKPNGPDSLLNCIERGWKFYDERPYLAGLFYWTGFDYRGEPNPMKFPATGSQFGILDYCGFPKDEAWYLKSGGRMSRCCTSFLTGICKVTKVIASIFGYTATAMKWN